MPLDQTDAAIGKIDNRGGKNFTDQGFYFNIGIPNCQGIWPDEYGETFSQSRGIEWHWTSRIKPWLIKFSDGSLARV